MTCSTGPTAPSTIDWSRGHRGIKQRYYPMRGFGSVASASRFCRAFDEVRQFFRVRTTMRATGFAFRNNVICSVNDGKL